MPEEESGRVLPFPKSPQDQSAENPDMDPEICATQSDTKNLVSFTTGVPSENELVELQSQKDEAQYVARERYLLEKEKELKSRDSKEYKSARLRIQDKNKYPNYYLKDIFITSSDADFQANHAFYLAIADYLKDISDKEKETELPPIEKAQFLLRSPLLTYGIEAGANDLADFEEALEEIQALSPQDRELFIEYSASALQDLMSLLMQKNLTPEAAQTIQNILRICGLIR